MSHGLLENHRRPGDAASSADELLTLLETRRSVAVTLLTDTGPSKDQLRRMLTIAVRVPDHGVCAPASMKIHANSTLLMIGDSITDCGRVRPVAESVGSDLGNGYVALIHAMLNATCPQRHIRIRNTGISGNTVRDLTARWQSDVLDLKPDWVSIIR